MSRKKKVTDLPTCRCEEKIIWDDGKGNQRFECSYSTDIRFSQKVKNQLILHAGMGAYEAEKFLNDYPKRSKNMLKCVKGNLDDYHLHWAKIRDEQIEARDKLQKADVEFSSANRPFLCNQYSLCYDPSDDGDFMKQFAEKRNAIVACHGEVAKLFTEPFLDLGKIGLSLIDSIQAEQDFLQYFNNRRVQQLTKDLQGRPSKGDVNITLKNLAQTFIQFHQWKKNRKCKKAIREHCVRFVAVALAAAMIEVPESGNIAESHALPNAHDNRLVKRISSAYDFIQRTPKPLSK
ncbi:MAG: hypothetical protein C4527_15120 [Candidatus Omnitrophota bacterium]|nr:MAG: hypothetical protein C4527_15120 [Candidatus Omnitrophota bacterium]